MKLLLLLLSLLPTLLPAGNPFLAAGSEAAALSNIQLFGSKAFVGINNVSRLTKTNKNTFAFACQKLYFKTDIWQLDAAFYPSSKHVKSTFYYRNLIAPFFSYHLIGAGIGIDAHPKIQLGCQMELSLESISAYGKQWGSNWKMSVTTKLHPKWQTAWLIAANANWKYKSDKIHFNHVFAINYSSSNKSEIINEIQWFYQQTPVISTGIKFQLNPQWQLLCGYAFVYGQFASGLHYVNKKLSAGFSVKYHQFLGTGNALQIHYVL
jgi:hypothetical protein